MGRQWDDYISQEQSETMSDAEIREMNRDDEPVATPTEEPPLPRRRIQISLSAAEMELLKLYALSMGLNPESEADPNRAGGNLVRDYVNQELGEKGRREADRPHEFESERGETVPLGPCAMCGQPRVARIHT